MQDNKLVGKTYLIKTFGCQMNLHDSERVAGLLDDCGCNEVQTVEEADIVVFMTCSVREKADTHLYGAVSNLVVVPAPPCGKRVIAVGGCIAQRDGARLKKHIPNVDVVFGTSALASVPELLCEAFESDGSEVFVDTVEKNRGFSCELPSKREQYFHAWVPIMTGCNNFCTFCIVPLVRGRERSRVFERVVAEVARLIDDGVREVTLLGQNVNSYGRDLYGKPRFSELLREVGKTGIERIRFTSSNPKDLSHDTIRAMAETPNVMPQLHLAVQSGSNRILRAMHRAYNREKYLSVIAELKEAIPGIALSTDIIVGFPGETEEDFLQTMSLVDEVGYASAYTFIYSKRPGTPAAKIVDTTPHEVIQERFERLTKRIEELAYSANQVDLHAHVTALVEGTSKKNPSVLVGHSPKNQTVLFDLPEGTKPEHFIGQMCEVEISEAKTWYLRGSLVGDIS